MQNTKTKYSNHKIDHAQVISHVFITAAEWQDTHWRAYYSGLDTQFPQNVHVLGSTSSFAHTLEQVQQ